VALRCANAAAARCTRTCLPRHAAFTFGQKPIKGAFARLMHAQSQPGKKVFQVVLLLVL